MSISAKIIESVPNFSEGRDIEKIERIVQPFRGREGVKLLDYQRDEDHNRCVVTVVGAPEPLKAAVLESMEAAIAAIDMRTHKGQHPRMGAVDVVPFIPVRGISTAEAVEIAREFGRFVGALGVPVYYYEDAATRPERTRLPDIRKGQYEALEAKLKDPAWIPDEGPATFNPKSGATVTGARFPLIAFNVNLRATDVPIADRIARAVRHINGGYRFVRAIGLALEDQGLVQVSLNLTNYTQTPIHRVLETIRSEAARYGVSIAGTELVGPVPLGAFEEVVRYYLRVHNFRMDQIIETALL